MAKIDKEFMKYLEQINEQVSIAAKALHKANEIRRKANIATMNECEYIYDYDEDVELDGVDLSELMSELQDAGWSTSGMSC